MTNFNLLDWIVLLILLSSIVLSALKSFVRELLGILSLFAAFFVGVWFYRAASTSLKEVVKSENIALFLSFVFLFLGTLLVGALVIWALQKLIKFAKIQWFDRLLGAAFGIIRGWILGSIVFLALTSFNLQTERVKSSQLGPYYLPGAGIIAFATPSDLRKSSVREKLESLVAEMIEKRILLDEAVGAFEKKSSRPLWARPTATRARRPKYSASIETR